MFILLFSWGSEILPHLLIYNATHTHMRKSDNIEFNLHGAEIEISRKKEYPIVTIIYKNTSSTKTYDEIKEWSTTTYTKLRKLLHNNPKVGNRLIIDITKPEKEVNAQHIYGAEIWFYSRCKNIDLREFMELLEDVVYTIRNSGY